MVHIGKIKHYLKEYKETFGEEVLLKLVESMIIYSKLDL